MLDPMRRPSPAGPGSPSNGQHSRRAGDRGDHSRRSTNQALRLDGDPAEQALEVVLIEDGLGQATDRPEVAVNAPRRSGSGNRHAAPSKESAIVRSP